MKRDTKRVIVFLCALLALSTVFSITQAQRASVLENQVHAEYQRAFYETVELVDSMQGGLEKLMVTASCAQEQQLLGDIARQAQSMQSNLSALPSNLEVVSGSIKFANQLGDFCRTLGDKLSSGGAVSQQDNRVLVQLHETCTQLKGQLSAMTMAMETGGQVLTEKLDVVSLNDTQPAQSLVSFPTLLYDGPFSDGRETGRLAALGSGEYDSAAALEKAQSFLGEDRVSRAFITGEGETPTPVWEITCFTDDGILVMAVTKQGGQVLYVIDESGAEKSQYTTASAIDLAHAFLKQQGYGDMEVSYWVTTGHQVIVNFAAKQAGVILYPDLIKVQMSLETGRVVGFEALNYLSSHQERTDLIPTLSAQEAEARLSSHLQCRRVRLCVIPLEVGEALCYECLTALGESEFLIYIDAHTGEERQIYKIISDQDGMLAV